MQIEVAWYECLEADCEGSKVVLGLASGIAHDSRVNVGEYLARFEIEDLLEFMDQPGFTKRLIVGVEFIGYAIGIKEEQITLVEADTCIVVGCFTVDPEDDVSFVKHLDCHVFAQQ